MTTLSRTLRKYIHRSNITDINIITNGDCSGCSGCSSDCCVGGHDACACLGDSPSACFYSCYTPHIVKLRKILRFIA
jgi:hypothetical protein